MGSLKRDGWHVLFLHTTFLEVVLCERSKEQNQHVGHVWKTQEEWESSCHHHASRYKGESSAWPSCTNYWSLILFHSGDACFLKERLSYTNSAPFQSQWQKSFLLAGHLATSICCTSTGEMCHLYQLLDWWFLTSPKHLIVWIFHCRVTKGMKCQRYLTRSRLDLNLCPTGGSTLVALFVAD